MENIMSRKEERRRKREQMIEENGLIYLEDVSKVYSAGAPALNGVTLHIAQGEFVFIVGDSGSGKSTLIKLLLRELTATSGKVWVTGQDVAKLPHRKIPKFIYKKYPRLRVALSRRIAEYNHQLDMVEEMEDKGLVDVIRPLRPMDVDRIEKDEKKLEALYEEGFQLGEEFCKLKIERWKN